MAKNGCKDCSAKCCRYVATEIDKPEKQEDYEEIIWYLLHEKICVFIDDGEWYLQFDTDCKSLDESGECKIYDKRPKICRKLSTSNCEHYGEGKPYDVIFKNPEDFVKYMKERGVEIKGWD
jgi:Fe-S-cluster containining protein